MNKSKEIITAYLNNELEVRDVQNKLAEIIWDVEDVFDRATQQFTYSVALLISEFTAGHRTEVNFKEELTKLLNN